MFIFYKNKVFEQIQFQKRLNFCNYYLNFYMINTKYLVLLHEKSILFSKITKIVHFLKTASNSVALSSDNFPPITKSYCPSGVPLPLNISWPVTSQKIFYLPSFPFRDL